MNSKLCKKALSINLIKGCSRMVFP